MINDDGNDNDADDSCNYSDDENFLIYRKYELHSIFIY